MDGREVLAEAVRAGSLTDAESITAVLDHRARQLIPVTLPLDGGWAARAPRMPEPGTDRLLAEVGQAMDERIARLGEHVAETLPLWAERDLGPVPDDPAERQDWLDRAAAVEAYREMKDWRLTRRPDRARARRDRRRSSAAAWHTALMALAKADGIDLSGLSEDAAAGPPRPVRPRDQPGPAHVGRELRLARQARDQAAERMMRSMREAGVAADAGHRGAAPAERGPVGSRPGPGSCGGRRTTRLRWRPAPTGTGSPSRRCGRRWAPTLRTGRRDPWRQREPLRSHGARPGDCRAPTMRSWPRSA